MFKYMLNAFSCAFTIGAFLLNNLSCTQVDVRMSFVDKIVITFEVQYKFTTVCSPHIQYCAKVLGNLFFFIKILL